MTANEIREATSELQELAKIIERTARAQAFLDVTNKISELGPKAKTVDLLPWLLEQSLVMSKAKEAKNVPIQSCKE